jgi:hypothetical protein
VLAPGLALCDAVDDPLGVALVVADGVGVDVGLALSRLVSPDNDVRSVPVVPPVIVDTALPLSSSNPVITAIATRNSPAAPSPTRFQGTADSLSRQSGPDGAGGGSLACSSDSAASSSAFAAVRRCRDWTLSSICSDARPTCERARVTRRAASAWAAVTPCLLTSTPLENTELATAATTLPSAAPATVPAAPSVDSRTADAIAAKAPAATVTRSIEDRLPVSFWS